MVRPPKPVAEGSIGQPFLNENHSIGIEITVECVYRHI